MLCLTTSSLGLAAAAHEAQGAQAGEHHGVGFGFRHGGGGGFGVGEVGVEGGAAVARDGDGLCTGVQGRGGQRPAVGAEHRAVLPGSGTAVQGDTGDDVGRSFKHPAGNHAGAAVEVKGVAIPGAGGGAQNEVTVHRHRSCLSRQGGEQQGGDGDDLLDLHDEKVPPGCLCDGWARFPEHAPQNEFWRCGPK
jgi:hypothetical protein